jgi:hypothetical protein
MFTSSFSGFSSLLESTLQFRFDLWQLKCYHSVFRGMEVETHEDCRETAQHKLKIPKCCSPLLSIYWASLTLFFSFFTPLSGNEMNLKRKKNKDFFWIFLAVFSRIGEARSRVFIVYHTRPLQTWKVGLHSNFEIQTFIIQKESFKVWRLLVSRRSMHDKKTLR